MGQNRHLRLHNILPLKKKIAPPLRNFWNYTRYPWHVQRSCCQAALGVSVGPSYFLDAPPITHGSQCQTPHMQPTNVNHFYEPQAAAAKCDFVFINGDQWTLNTVQAQTEKDSSCPLSSSPSPIEVTRLAPNSASLSSTAWAKAQNCGYMREPRPKTLYLCNTKRLVKYPVL